MTTVYLEEQVASNIYKLETPIIEQLHLFEDPGRWPKRPYCAQSLEHGVRIRSLAQALRRPYIQANPPHLRVWSIFDVDRPGAALAWENGLPEPNWITINKQNAHAHLVWGLSAPVLVESASARHAPIRYLLAVESAFRARLQADSGYSGLITKNPAHPLWRTLRGPSEFYDLAYLSEFVDLPKFRPKQGTKLDEIGLGRNCILFDFLRKWAYKAVRDHRDQRNYVLWQAQAYDRALNRNADFKDQLDPKEVWHIAQSVTKWVWKTDPLAEAAFLARQAIKGRKGGLAGGKKGMLTRWGNNEDKRSSARLMAAAGTSTRSIAAELEIDQSTVVRWLQKG